MLYSLFGDIGWVQTLFLGVFSSVDRMREFLTEHRERLEAEYDFIRYHFVVSVLDGSAVDATEEAL
jgi:hypothetical protein